MGQSIKRGDIVTVAAKGHYSGKPRPALVLQSDLFSVLGSVTLCLLTTDIVDAPLFRLSVEPSPANGLLQTSQIMIDKIVTVPQDTIGARIGALDREIMVRADRSLAVWDVERGGYALKSRALSLGWN